ncbi:MAG TPA: acyltransferase, partial [Vicinamibacterales bacterium]|nr:acyltransferase [Vicinamibacterales bacterium]
VFCGPSVVFTNVMNPRSEIPRMTELRSTLVKRGATLGANCTVVCGVTIGAYAFVGAGSVVLRDVPDFALVVGNPARLAGWRCVCGNPLGLDERGASATCGDCGRTFSKTGTSLALESSPVGAGSSQ